MSTSSSDVLQGSMINISLLLKAPSSIPLNLSSFFGKPDVELLDFLYEEGELTTKSVNDRLDTDNVCSIALKNIVRQSQSDNQTVWLLRNEHKRFLDSFLGRLPAGFSGLDASRPWVPYWCLNAIAALGFDASAYRARLYETLRPIQNASGGFGGGQGQYSHLATTYASVLAVCITGGGDLYDLIDRQALWQWMGTLKEANGSFRISQGAEVDIRAAYIILVLIKLLNLPMTLPSTATTALAAGHETFTDGLLSWIASCQTYEGGLGSIPGAEAHGAYTFCGLACLCIIDEPQVILPNVLNIETLAFWLAHRQNQPTGGLAGRTNKLVDGCYSSWIGGCYALVEAALPGLIEQGGRIWEPNGLVQYIYGCAQCTKPAGGLRDKPGMRPDAYHTNYNLLGLGSAQYRFVHRKQKDVHNEDSSTAGFDWTARRRVVSSDVFEEVFLQPEDDVVQMSPTFNIPMSAVAAVRTYFKSKPMIGGTSESIDK